MAIQQNKVDYGNEAQEAPAKEAEPAKEAGPAKEA